MIFCFNYITIENKENLREGKEEDEETGDEEKKEKKYIFNKA